MYFKKEWHAKNRGIKIKNDKFLFEDAPIEYNKLTDDEK